MFAGINAAIIMQRQRYIQTNKKITQLPTNVWVTLITAYGDYNRSKDDGLLNFSAYETFSRICQENDISIEDFIFWWDC